MTKKLLKILFFIVFQLLLVSCKNTSQKMENYITTYNKSTQLITNDFITYTSARAFLKDNKIEIMFITNLEQNESNKMIYKQTLPDLFAEMLKKEELSMELIDEGINFEVFWLAKDQTILEQFTIDKKKLNELLKKDIKNGSVEKTVSSSTNASSDLQEMVALMNKNMPIKNTDGTKVLKIEINEKNELVYQIEAPNDFAKLLKNEGAKEIIKESILRSGNLKNIISAVQTYGINTIKYEYRDTKGKEVNDVVLTAKDLR